MMDLLLLALFTVAWCAQHSLLIAPPVTRWLDARLPGGRRAQRLAYNLIALVTLLLLLRYQLSIATAPLFAWAGAWQALRALLFLAAAALFWAGATHYDLRQFLGLRQLRRGDSGGGLTADGGLDTSGILGHVRHPWYTGALIVIWLRSLDASAIVLSALLTLYLVLGSILEERKLVAEFGEEYRDYQRGVPMLIPRLRGRSSPAGRR